MHFEFESKKFYREDGKPTWLLGVGELVSDGQGSYRWQATLRSYRGQPTLDHLRGAFDLNSSVSVSANLQFKDPQQLTFTWPGGTVQIAPIALDGDLSADLEVNQAEPGLWFDPKQPGWWIALSLSRTKLLAGLFAYDRQGDPIWYLTRGTFFLPGFFNGFWDEYSGGQTLSGSYREPTLARPRLAPAFFQTNSPQTLLFTTQDSEYIARRYPF